MKLACAVTWKKLGSHVGKPRKPGIFSGYERTINAPTNVQRGIVPQNTVLIGAVIEIAAHIKELDRIGESDKSVCKTGRNINHVVRFGAKRDRRPLAKCRRAGANIHSDIEGLPLNNAAELGLCSTKLVVQTSKRALYGSGVIILDEVVSDADRFEALPVVGLYKKATGILKNGRAELEYAVN